MSRRRKKRSAERRKPVGLPQLERKVLRNRFAPVEPLDDDQINAIHDASMSLLEDQGIEVLGEMALDKFRRAGADVDDNGIVRMDRDLVMETIASAPRSFEVFSRNDDNTLQVGDNIINFGLVSGPPNVHDCVNGRRMGNIADFKKLI
jgi:trimethylamine--corrinoid protein Co-methyltransferase